MARKPADTPLMFTLRGGNGRRLAVRPSQVAALAEDYDNVDEGETCVLTLVSGHDFSVYANFDTCHNLLFGAAP